MTKRHFIALADDIRFDRHLFSQAAVEVLAGFCYTQNPRFNRERWLSYIAGECGPCGGTIKPPCKPRVITPERKLARRLEGN